MSTGVEYSIIEYRRELGEDGKLLAPSSTTYIQLGGINHLDSVYGYTIQLQATRYNVALAVDNVVATLEQAFQQKDADALWSAVGAAVNIGTAGSGTPAIPTAVTVNITRNPTAPATYLPALRLKIVCTADTGGTLTAILRTARGV
jgi:hypothetical protein